MEGKWIKMEKVSAHEGTDSFYEVDKYGESTGRVKTEYPATAATGSTPVVVIYDFRAQKGATQ